MKMFDIDFCMWTVKAKTEQAAINKVHKFFNENCVRPSIYNVCDSGEDDAHEDKEFVNLEKRKLTKICIIQEEFDDGIVEEPRLFLTEKEADQIYINCVNENHEQKFKTLNDAMEYMCDVPSGYFVRYWVMEIPK